MGAATSELSTISASAATDQLRRRQAPGLSPLVYRRPGVPVSIARDGASRAIRLVAAQDAPAIDGVVFFPLSGAFIHSAFGYVADDGG